MTWTTIALGKICEITSSRRIFAHEYQAEGVPFFRGKEIVEKFNGAQTVSTELYISRIRFDEIADKHGAPETGDLLLTSVGTLGVPYLVGPGEEFYFKDGNLTWFRPGTDMDSAFLYYWLLSPQGRGELGKSTIGTSQSAYTIELLKRMRISLPAVTTQTEVASVLKSYDDLIENNRRRMALLEESVRLLYREWFVRLRFPGYEHTPIVDGVPQGWELAPLEDALVLQRGFDLPTQSRQDGTVPIYGSTGILGYHDKVKAAAPGVVTGRSGTLGEVQYVCEDYWPLNTALWVKEFRRVTPLFALFLLREMNLKQYNGGASVPTLDRKSVHRVEILIPPPLLLRSFDEHAIEVFAQITNLNTRNQKLRAARDLLLPRLMSGELAV